MRLPRPIALLPLLGLTLLTACRATEPARHATKRVATAAESPDSGAAKPSPLADPSYQRLHSRGGNYVLCWRPALSPVPRNETFELELWVFEGDRPLPGVQVLVRGWMPDHGHGMLRAPNVVDQGDGSYRVQNMLLHMRGHWQLFFDLLRDGHADVAECDLRL